MDKEKFLDAEIVEKYLKEFKKKEISREDVEELFMILTLTRVILEFQPNFNLGDQMRIKPKCVRSDDGDLYIALFTSNNHRFLKADEEQSSTINVFFPDLCDESLIEKSNLKGFVINPFTESFVIEKEMIKSIINYKKYKNKKIEN